MMVMLGTDAHKRSHTIVAVDPVGADIGSVTVAATTDGHLSLEKQQTSPASVPRTPTPCDQTGMGAANNTRFRLNRGGNRQTNAALHRIAITQMRIHPDAQAFIKRRLETGSTKREAIRLLKRKLANVVYRNLLADTQPAQLQRAA